MREKRINEIKGVVFVAAGLIILASLISWTPFDLPFYTSHPNIPPKNFIRSFGAYFSGALFLLLGWTSYLIPGYILLLGARLFRQEKPDLRMPKIAGLCVLLLSLSSLIAASNPQNAAVKFSRAGFFGYVISRLVCDYFGVLGGYILFITLIILSLALVTNILISDFFLGVFAKIKPIFRVFASGIRFPVRRERLKFDSAGRKQKEKGSLISHLQEKIAGVADSLPRIKPEIRIKEGIREVKEAKSKPRVSGGIEIKSELQDGNYKLPALDLLDSPPALEERQIKDDLQDNARILEETLDDFGISVKVTDIEKGPVITRYELEPAPGVKLNRIVALNDDISLAMKASSVRIVAPIPGKARVGVEVPNSQSSFVYLKELLTADGFRKTDSKLTLALGKDIAGHPVIADLGDMPHLLIAGTTGSGKTVCVNSLILSLLFKCCPGDLKLLMVDPKMVELAPFNGMPHLICPVVTDAKKAAAALGWVVNEMEERYQLLAKAGARNLDAYNQREEKIPYIVVIIDEMADLMMVARDQIESAITRLAQLSRAVGIHLIMATQRPSVDVITGVIKANFPSRISFKVASKVDSRTVLDMNGADKLLGKGDMLFLRPGEEKLTRAQGCLVKDSEIERVVSFIKQQAEPVYDEQILNDQQKTILADGEKDEIYDEAVRIIMESNQASVSILQRRLRLGYTRAARIIDTMEQEGLVGAFEGSKPRKILADRDKWLIKQRTADKTAPAEQGGE